MKRAFVIPVKAFAKAKNRLSDALDLAAREALAEKMAWHVLSVAKSLKSDVDIFVACDDDVVSGWAKGHGAEVIWSEGYNLNGTAELAAQIFGNDGYGEMILAHSDLPLARDFTPLFSGEILDGSSSGVSGEPSQKLSSASLSISKNRSISIAPDRQRQGTNVLRVPLRCGFKFCYGSNSFAHHIAEARQLGLEVEIVEADDLAIDIDEVDDLELIPDGFLAG